MVQHSLLDKSDRRCPRESSAGNEARLGESTHESFIPENSARTPRMGILWRLFSTVSSTRTVHFGVQNLSEDII